MKILYNDLCKSSDLTDATYGTNIRQLRPASNVAVPGIAASGAWVFGTESPDSQAVRLQFDFGSAQNVNYVGVLAFDGFSEGTNWSIKLGTTLGGSDVLNQGGLTLDSPPEGEMQGYHKHLATNYSARYLQIEIHAKEFQSVSIGRIMAGETWDVGAEVNFQLGYRDMGIINRSLSGIANPVERGRLKTMDLRFIGIGDEDLIGTSSEPMSFTHMDSVAGSTGEVCAFINTEDWFHTHRYGIYGFMEQNAPASARANSANGYVTTKQVKIISAA